MPGKPLRILLLGKGGQLGWELERTLAPLGETFACDYPQVDFVDGAALREFVMGIRPGLIVNATAYTDVDRAESEPELAMAVNSAASGILAETALALGAALVHYSTDYVFDGLKGEPYQETDQPGPLSVYAESKLAGEKAIQQVGGSYLILRTAWVYSLRRPSFVTKVLSWARSQSTLHLVTDQVSNPTWCRMLAEATAQALAKGGEEVIDWLDDRSGVYHLAGEGYTSRLEWGVAILKSDPRREEQVIKDVIPAQTADFPAPAKRPSFSALDCTRFARTFGLRLPPWEIALRLAMETDGG